MQTQTVSAMGDEEDQVVAEMFDFWSFIVFVVLFFLFNVIFWAIVKAA